MNKKDLLASSLTQLRRVASELRIRGRSKMNKTQLASAITRAGGRERVEETLGKPTPLKAQGEESTGRPRTQAGPLRDTVLVRRSWREQQAVIQHAKYEAKLAGAPRPGKRGEPQELPASYDEDRVVLLVRDPYWIHVYWDISRDTLLKAKAELKDEWFDAKSILRVYDITGVDFDGANANSHSDIEISGGASNWYVNTRIPNRTYCVEVGLLSRSGRFFMLARSNRATTPRDAPSEATDEQWMIPDWEFEKVYALSGGFSIGTGSLELKEMMEKALGGAITSGAPGSLAISSPMGRKPRARGFWFRIGTELIVYGATEPDAKVTLQGEPVELRPDGTFTVRFDLPDGKQVIPATAESSDGVDRITITPVVTKKTEK
jgi:hypothetical protein